MAFYGNILTLFDANESSLEAIRIILQSLNSDFEEAQSTFFIETNSRAHTQSVMQALSEMDLRYIFFHNNNSTGSRVAAKNVSNEQCERVIKIMLE